MSEIEKAVLDAMDLIAKESGIPRVAREISKKIYRAGFMKAKEKALEIWDHSDHTYCDFFHAGRDLLEKIGDV